MPDYEKLIQVAKATFPAALEADPWVYDDHLYLQVKREAIMEVSTALRKNPDFACEFVMDVTCIDYLTMKKTPRFEMVYHWFSFSHKHRVCVKAGVPEEDPSIDSILPLTKGVDWFEREVWDMYGISFNGRPDIQRVLLYPEFEGFPLRKDHPTTRSTPRITLRTPHKPEKTRWESLHGSPIASMEHHPDQEAPGPKPASP